MFTDRIHRYIFLFGACTMAFGMMMGPLLTSLPQIILMSNWVLEGNFKNKWQQLKANRVFWVVASVFLIHIFGIFYTHNLQEGLDDLRIKMPVLGMALVFFGSRPLSKQEWYSVLGCFMLGCVCNTVWCLIYSFILHSNEDGRNTSRYMSHIRLGLYLNMAIACCVYFFLKLQNRLAKTGLVLLAVYFLVTMVVLGLATGLANAFILSFAGLCVIIYRQKNRVQLVSFMVLLGLVIITANYINDIKNAQLTIKPTKNNTLLKYNAAGREYIYLDTLAEQKENGNLVFINIQVTELKKEWQRQFPADSFNYNPHPHNLKRFDVLLRYMASKGLNKDSAGLATLSAEDKANVQKGITNYLYPQWSFLHKRTYELVNDYDELLHSRDVNGHSLAMRLYFWKAALEVIRSNVLFGVGTGDVQQELNAVYAHTSLQQEWYKRPHNQFLTIAVALGIFGALVFLIALIYPVVALRKYLPALYWPFLILLLISFLMEDTLESQAGITFYVFFNTLFLSVAWFRKKVGTTKE